ncbi:hypothetical protein PHYC_03292 [Phycisphaerales bacterium]|nr:hypothetical protein PHYC_03292 [Phycisphaerales bacterium]
MPGLRARRVVKVDAIFRGRTAIPIDESIRIVRGQRVILDMDIAALYGVTTSALNQAVRRNRPRFPGDFCFRLSRSEAADLKSQTVTSSASRSGWGGRRRSYPLAFTEQGVAMLSSVLRSPRAVRVNIEIMRAFVRLRRMLGEHADLKRRLEELEAKYDGQFALVFQAIRDLMSPPEEDESARTPIGFRSE